jgi:hypothetical protein
MLGECLGRCERRFNEEGEKIIKWQEVCNFLLSLKCYWDGHVKEHGAARCYSSTGDVDLKFL